MVLPSVDGSQQNNNNNSAWSPQPPQQRSPGVSTRLGNLNQQFSDPGGLIEGIQFSAVRGLVALGAVWICKTFLSAKLEGIIEAFLPLGVMISALGFYIQTFDSNNRSLRIVSAASAMFSILFATLTAPPLLLAQIFMAIIGMTFASMLTCSIVAVMHFYARQRLFAVVGFGFMVAYLSLSSQLPT